MMAAHRPLTAPTDRSISPSSRMSTTPTDTVPIGAIWSARFVRFVEVRKFELATAKIRPDQREDDEDAQRAELALAPGG